MLPFLDSFGAWTLATFPPVVAGFTLMVLVGGLVKPRYLAAFALGIFFWFFVDTIQGSSNLQVSAGFGGGIGQVAMVVLFAVGAIAFFSLDRSLFSEPGEVPALLVPLLVAMAVGIHGLGEGSAFGSTAAQTSIPSVLAAFGGVAEGSAYVLHKLLEPMMAGAVYALFTEIHPRSSNQLAREILLLSLAFTIPSLIGAAAGYYLSYDATYFFALGTGTSLYAAFRLAGQTLTGPGARNDSSKVAVALVLGFILIYLAALVHA